MTAALPRYARDLDINPVGCGISPHAYPAVWVVRAVAFSAHGDITHHDKLVCDHQLCIEDAELHAAAISHPSVPFVRELATVEDLEVLSGVDVTGVLLGGAA